MREGRLPLLRDEERERILAAVWASEEADRGFDVMRRRLFVARLNKRLGLASPCRTAGLVFEVRIAKTNDCLSSSIPRLSRQQRRTWQIEYLREDSAVTIDHDQVEMKTFFTVDEVAPLIKFLVRLSKQGYDTSFNGSLKVDSVTDCTIIPCERSYSCEEPRGGKAS